MIKFMQKYQEKATAIISGFDRLVFRGVLRAIVYPDGMKRHLSHQDVPRREFGAYVKRTTAQVNKASIALAEELNRPVVYVPSSKTRKEALARTILAQNPIDSGLVCVLRCVEPCMTYDMYRNRAAKKLELVYRPRKCLHLYHYYLDPLFGFMHARLQTWFPFHIQICINGREWLARRMDEEGLAYTRHENSFPYLQNPVRAQQLLQDLVHLDWVTILRDVAARLNPIHEKLFGPYIHYYWSTHQSEWATDITFASSQNLQDIYPQLVRGAITTFSSRDVMRFLGKQLQQSFQGQAISHYEHRAEGLRIKHSVDTNSVKMYDKGGRILRVETTINDPYAIKVYRPAQQGDSQDIAPRPLRKGVADLERRAAVSQRANERYLDALTQLDTHLSLSQLLCPLTKRITRHGVRYRGLRPWNGQDLQLLKAISAPEFLLAGFRNADLSAQVFPNLQKILSAKRTASGRISYRIRLLHAHGLIAKIPHTRRYRITPRGQRVCTALLLAQDATVQQLNPKAA